MPRNSSGTYQQPANTAAVTNTAIGSAAYNSLISDIGAELTNSLDRQGRSAMAAPLPMGNNKITGMADPTSATDGATKNYTDNAVAAFFSTGDVKLTYKTVADTGWLMCNDQTIGNAGSGATYANTDAQALFTLLWTNISNTYAPVSGGRGVSAAADWTGLKTLSLAPMMGRALGIAGAGSGLTSRALGQYLGAESVSLGQTNLPNLNFTVTDPGHAHTTVDGGGPQPSIVGTTTITVNAVGGGAFSIPAIPLDQKGSGFYTTASHTTGITVASGGSGTAISLMQPTSFLNAMIKK